MSHLPLICARLCTEEGMNQASKAYRGRMHARAHAVLGDHGLAEEAVQEAFLRAWRACGSFDARGGPMVNWLLVITRNVAIDMAKARSRRPLLAADPADLVPRAHRVTGESLRMRDHTELIALRADLRELLTRIGEQGRTAVVETVVRDRAYADVAADLGVPIGTVRTRVFYALRQLRSLWEAPEAA